MIGQDDRDAVDFGEIIEMLSRQVGELECQLAEARGEGEPCPSRD